MSGRGTNRACSGDTRVWQRERASWRTPALATLQRPVMSPLRQVGLLTLRCYLVIAVILVIAKVVQLGIT
jgi:hypothetical protein